MGYPTDCYVDFLSDQRKFRAFARPRPSSKLVLGGREGAPTPSVDSVSCVACKVALYFRRAAGTPRLCQCIKPGDRTYEREVA